MAENRDNNFDALRILAAIGVLFGHAYGPLFNLPVELFAKYAVSQTSAGLAVNVFFVLSGYLVTRSRLVVRDGTVLLWNRILRLIPGVTVCTILVGSIIGGFYTTFPLSTFFGSPDTWPFFLSVFIFPLNDKLPGVFTNLPEGPSIMGRSIR